MKYHHFMCMLEEYVVRSVEGDTTRLTPFIQQYSSEVRRRVETSTFLDPEAGYEEAEQDLKKRYCDESMIVD